jgi:hypothetical protein
LAIGLLDSAPQAKRIANPLQDTILPHNICENALKFTLVLCVAALAAWITPETMPGQIHAGRPGTCRRPQPFSWYARRVEIEDYFRRLETGTEVRSS